MKQHTVTLAGEELDLTLTGRVVSISTGGVVAHTECESLCASRELFHEVRDDLSDESLFFNDLHLGDGEVARCHVSLDGTAIGRDSMSKRKFTSFKEFIQWGSENHFNLH